MYEIYKDKKYGYKLHKSAENAQGELDPNSPEYQEQLKETFSLMHEAHANREAFKENDLRFQGNAQTGKIVLEKIIEQYKHFSSEIKLSKREMLLRTVAWQQAIKTGISLSEKEMQNLINDLFQCHQPNSSPAGKPTYLEFRKEQLEKMFGR